MCRVRSHHTSAIKKLFHQVDPVQTQVLTTVGPLTPWSGYERVRSLSLVLRSGVGAGRGDAAPKQVTRLQVPARSLASKSKPTGAEHNLCTGASSFLPVPALERNAELKRRGFS